MRSTASGRRAGGFPSGGRPSPRALGQGGGGWREPARATGAPARTGIRAPARGPAGSRRRASSHTMR
eukprot:6134923-Alexandrium_andersonii.AAC.1